MYVTGLVYSSIYIMAWESMLFASVYDSHTAAVAAPEIGILEVFNWNTGNRRIE